MSSVIVVSLLLTALGSMLRSASICDWEWCASRPRGRTNRVGNGARGVRASRRDLERWSEVLSAGKRLAHPYASLQRAVRRSVPHHQTYKFLQTIRFSVGATMVPSVSSVPRTRRFVIDEPTNQRADTRGVLHPRSVCYRTDMRLEKAYSRRAQRHEVG